MSKTKVLVIDDDPQFSSLLQLNLGQSGEYEVHTQIESKQAIATVRELMPDLILLDIVMPAPDGGDIRRMLREDPLLDSIRVIIISAIVDRPPIEREDDDEPEWVISGGEVMLPKTATPEGMRDTIEKMMAGYFDGKAGGGKPSG